MHADAKQSVAHLDNEYCLQPENYRYYYTRLNIPKKYKFYNRPKQEKDHEDSDHVFKKTNGR